MSAISSNLGQVFSGSMPGSVAPAMQGDAAASLGDLAAPASQSHSASRVMIDAQSTTLLSTFQTALESEDTLKMMLAMLILDALGGKDKDEKDSSLAALALLGAAAGSSAGGAFMASYQSISQIDSQTVSSMNQQLAGSAGYVGGSSPPTGGTINVTG